MPVDNDAWRTISVGAPFESVQELRGWLPRRSADGVTAVIMDALRDQPWKKALARVPRPHEIGSVYLYRLTP
jgi:hypothetical protein